VGACAGAGPLGQKLVQIYYSVTMVSPLGRGDVNERTLKAIYKAAGWDLIDETYLQTGGLLASFPLTLADGLSRDLTRMRRFRTVLSANVAALAPVQGEYNGGAIPHLLFIGRRGQPQFWSPFQNNAGNHNVAIAGKSGSGKSVLLQDLTASLAGVNAKTIVIDDGRSFEHMARPWAAPSPSSSCRRHLDQPVPHDRPRACGGRRGLSRRLPRHAQGHHQPDGPLRNRLNDTERGLIDAAVNAVWNEKAREGTVDGIIAALHAAGHPQADDLATALPFRRPAPTGRSSWRYQSRPLGRSDGLRAVGPFLTRGTAQRGPDLDHVRRLADDAQARPADPQGAHHR
jgi:conjugal transfer ATP-binding protein TraC